MHLSVQINAKLNLKSYLNHTKSYFVIKDSIINNKRKKYFFNNREVEVKSMYSGNKCSGFSSQL